MTVTDEAALKYQTYHDKLHHMGEVGEAVGKVYGLAALVAHNLDLKDTTIAAGHLRAMKQIKIGVISDMRLVKLFDDVEQSTESGHAKDAVEAMLHIIANVVKFCHHRLIETVEDELGISDELPNPFDKIDNPID
jgi:hypothetical protein